MHLTYHRFMKDNAHGPRPATIPADPGKRWRALLQWDALDETIPWVLWQRNNTLLAVLAFRGLDLESQDDPVLVAQASQLNQTFRRFDGDGAM